MKLPVNPCKNVLSLFSFFFSFFLLIISDKVTRECLSSNACEFVFCKIQKIEITDDCPIIIWINFFSLSGWLKHACQFVGLIEACFSVCRADWSMLFSLSGWLKHAFIWRFAINWVFWKSFQICARQIAQKE